LLAAAVSQGAFSTCAVDQDSTHRLGHHGEEMGAILKFWGLIGHEPEPSLMDESRRLKCMLGRFVGEFVSRQPAQFLVNERQQLISSSSVASLHAAQKVGYLAHTFKRQELRIWP
jgi:hypothetical protein